MRNVYSTLPTQQSLADGSVTLHIQSSFTSYFPRNHHCIISSVSVRSALMHNDRKLSSWHGVSRLFVDHQHLCLVHGNQWTCLLLSWFACLFLVLLLYLGLVLPIRVRETPVTREILNRRLQLYEWPIPLCIVLPTSIPTWHLHQHLRDRTQSAKNTNFLLLPQWARVTVTPCSNTT